jgi:hypothetical protein
VGAGAARPEAATGRDRLRELRAKLAENGLLGRASGLERESRLAISLTAEPELGAQILYDAARAQAALESRLVTQTLETLLATFPKAEPWASLAAYEMGRMMADRTASRPKAAPFLVQFLAAKDRDPIRTARALVTLAELEAEAGKRDEALARLRSVLDRFPGHDQLRATAMSRMGRVLAELKQVDEAAELYDRLSAEYPWELEARGSLLGALIQAYRTAEGGQGPREKAAIAACEQYLADFPTAAAERSSVYVALATLHGQRKDAEAAGNVYRRMTTDPALAPYERTRARLYLFAHYRRQGGQAAIIHQAHELMAADPVAVAIADQVVSTFVDALIETGRVDEAVAMARADWRLAQLTLSTEAATTRSARATSTGDDPLFTLVRALKAKEGGLRSANALIQFVAAGPEGADGTAGTADDQKDPLAAFSLPAEAERDKLFAEAARRLAAEPLKLACLYAYWDKPAESLRAFRLHYLRATTAAGLKAAATVLAQAMRAFGRPEAEVDAFFAFQNSGPAGADGKPGTADDLKDPILELK